MSQNEDAKALIAKLEQLTNAPQSDLDDSTRIKLREASKNLSISLEMHGDTMHRIGNAVCSLLHHT